MLKALGHQKIISIDLKEENLAAATKAGATATVDGKLDNLEAAILEATGGPVLGVIDFVNNSKTAPVALAILNKGGRIVQVGVMGGEMTLSLAGVIFKAATIVGNNTGSLAHLNEVAKLAKEKKLLPIPITSIPWDNANEAISRLRDGKTTGRLVLTKS